MKISRSVFSEETEAKCFTLVDDAGKSITKDFTIDDGNREVIKKLIHYFAASQHCEELGIDPGKGILLAGPVGTGKTLIFDVFSIIVYHLWRQRKFSKSSARDVAKEFSIGGYEAFDKYIKPQGDFRGQNSTHIIYLFDDLGNEIQGKHYGQTTNVMTEIIQDRYEIWTKEKYPTHFTTNMTPEELLEYYGSRIRSRLRQMCNILTLTGKDRRK